MRAYKVVALSVLGSVSQFGCTGSPPSPQQLVSVGAVMNSLMCGMVKAHKDPQSGPLLDGKQASVALELKIVNSSSAGLTVGSGGGSGSSSGSGSKPGGGSPSASTSVIAWQGFSFGPSFGATYTEGWTVDTTTTVTFSFPSSPKEDNISVCKTKAGEDSDQFGFSRWLAETLGSLVTVSDISRTGIPDKKLSYDANFGVTSGVNGSVTIIPLTGVAIPITPSGSYSRNDVQHLTINIPPAKQSSGPLPGGAFVQQFQLKNPPVVSLKSLRPIPE